MGMVKEPVPATLATEDPDTVPYVGNRGSGYRTHQAGGQNRNFSRTAYGPAGQSVRRINKELAKSGGFQISAEQNEQVNERGRYAH